MVHCWLQSIVWLYTEYADYSDYSSYWKSFFLCTTEHDSKSLMSVVWLGDYSSSSKFRKFPWPGNSRAYRNSWTLDTRVGRWTLDAGLWTLHSGRCTLDAGLWTLDDGRCTLDAGRWTLDSGRWTMDSRRWTLDVRPWTLDDGRWTLDSRPWTLHSGN